MSALTLSSARNPFFFFPSITVRGLGLSPRSMFGGAPQLTGRSWENSFADAATISFRAHWSTIGPPNRCYSCFPICHARDVVCPQNREKGGLSHRGSGMLWSILTTCRSNPPPPPAPAVNHQPCGVSEGGGCRGWFIQGSRLPRIVPFLTVPPPRAHDPFQPDQLQPFCAALVLHTRHFGALWQR